MLFDRLFIGVRRERRRERIDVGEEELFDILADSRRRAVIERVAAAGPDPLSCVDLAVAIAADETHMDPGTVPTRRVEPVDEDLRSDHLPRLAAVGLVRWDADAGTVRPGHSVDEVARLLGEIGHRVRRAPVLPSSPWQAGEPNETVVSPTGASRPALPDGGRTPE